MADWNHRLPALIPLSEVAQRKRAQSRSQNTNLEEHDFAESTLCISCVLKRIKHLLERYHFPARNATSHDQKRTPTCTPHPGHTHNWLTTPSELPLALQICSNIAFSQCPLPSPHPGVESTPGISAHGKLVRTHWMMKKIVRGKDRQSRGTVHLVFLSTAFHTMPYACFHPVTPKRLTSGNVSHALWLCSGLSLSTRDKMAAMPRCGKTS